MQNFEKIILSISDTHLGAGEYILGKKNVYEDFFHDQHLVDFFEYHCSDDFSGQEVEIVINGDFLDFVSVPYVQFFDNEFWSEEASVEKLKLIHKGHIDVFKAMEKFIEQEDKKITYVIGNHDAELILPNVREQLLSFFSKPLRSRFQIHWTNDPYNPAPGIYFQHGHQYEKAHQFDESYSIVTSKKNKRYFLPPWGTYYCHHVLNKYKPERNHVNQIVPIRNYLIHGLIFDTLFTARFIFSNIYYFAVMRFWSLYLSKLKFKKIFKDIREELVLFENYEKVTRKFFQSFDQARILLTGHTHTPTYRLYQDGTVFINSGTWTKVINMDNTSSARDINLAFAKVEILNKNYVLKDFHRNVRSDLLEWSGTSKLPYKVFNT